MVIAREKFAYFELRNTIVCHSRGGGNPAIKPNSPCDWIPASAGMTKTSRFVIRSIYESLFLFSINHIINNSAF